MNNFLNFKHAVNFLTRECTQIAMLLLFKFSLATALNALLLSGVDGILA